MTMGVKIANAKSTIHGGSGCTLEHPLTEPREEHTRNQHSEGGST